MATVIHRIEGSRYVDLLLKGKPTDAEAAALAKGAEWTLWPSLWSGTYVLRVGKLEHMHRTVEA